MILILAFFSLMLTDTRAQKIYINDSVLKSIQKEIGIKESHHSQAYQALKWRVNQDDLTVYREDVNRYNRSYLSQEFAFASLIERSEKEKKHYAKKAFDAIKSFYENPDQQRFPHKDYGLSRAMMQLGLALPYNWCKDYWTKNQTDFVNNKINEALDAWLTYDHANFWDDKGSNWVAVCRGGELVLLLASGQKEKRKERYNFLIEQLVTHMQNGYGDHGASQEGMGYIEYGGTFLLKAVFAAASLGDSTLYKEAQKHAWWKLAMYAESFQPHERKFLMTGVAGSSGIDEGWTSLLLNLVPHEELPYYQWFYDRHMGQLAPGTEQDKYDAERAGTIWSIMYYPVGIEPKDPSGSYQAGIYDSNGYFFFRNRWKNEDDILFSIMSDEHHHGHAWDQPEVFALNLMAHNTRYIGGPSKKRDNHLYSSLLVDSIYHFRGSSNLTGEVIHAQISLRGGNVGINGGALYHKLGLDQARRFMALQFEGDNDAVICIVDHVKAKSNHLLTWQLNVGDEKGKSGIDVILERRKFKLKSANGVVEGWILSPEKGTINQSEDPVQAVSSSGEKNLMMLLYIHDGASGIQAPEKLSEDGRYSFLRHTIWFDQSAQKLRIEN